MTPFVLPDRKREDDVSIPHKVCTLGVHLLEGAVFIYSRKLWWLSLLLWIMQLNTANAWLEILDVRWRSKVYLWCQRPHIRWWQSCQQSLDCLASGRIAASLWCLEEWWMTVCCLLQIPSPERPGHQLTPENLPKFDLRSESIIKSST